MSLLKNITRGGQTNLHDLRMITQVLKVALWVKTGLFLSIFSLLVWVNIPHHKLENYTTYRLAQFKTIVNKDAFVHVLRGKQQIEVKASQIAQSAAYKQNARTIEAAFVKESVKTALAAFFLTAFMIIFWYHYGRKQSGKSFKRGAQIVGKNELISIIKSRSAQSQFKIDDVPYLKAFETRHFLITGTTGAGKTNCLNGLLSQLIAKKSPAVIVDITGGFVEKFYNPETDIILNPFDERGAKWDFWADIHDEAVIEEFAKSLVPELKSNGDTFWQNAARTVLSETLQKYLRTKETNLQALYHLLAETDLEKFETYLSGTAASNLVDPTADRMAISIRATLITYIKLFKHLEAFEGGFSIRKWMANIDEDSNSRIFITCSQKYRELLKPLITAWFDLFMNSLMSLPANDTRRVWLIMDELAALQKLNSLSTGLAEVRKYGGCIVSCLQNKAQLEEIYGHLSLKNMLDNFNTKLFFRSTGREISSWASDTLGKSEVVEKVESISYGSHAMRDGVSIANQTKMASLLLPEDIQQFADLELVVKYPGDYPIARFKTQYNKIENHHAPFIEKQSAKKADVKEADPVVDHGERSDIKALADEITSHIIKKPERGGR